MPHRHLLAAAVLWGLLLTACSAPEPVPSAGTDPEAVRRLYDDLQREAMDAVRLWEQDPGDAPDPRPAWAERFEAFARENPESEQAADALLGVMDMRADRKDVEGFLRTYDLLLDISPDSPGLYRAFNQVMAMRLVEAGGPDIAIDPDPDARRLAYNLAAPRIIEDIGRALERARSDVTRASARYMLGLVNYQFEFDPQEARDQFSIVASEFAEWPQAASAQEFVRELSRLAVGESAPSFEVTTLEGKRVSLNALRGKVVLIDFWTTWCQPCVDEMPNLRRAYETYKEDGFTIVGINLDTDLDAVRRFVGEHRMSWPVSAEGKGMMDPLARRYSVQALPKSFLVGPGGKIRVRSPMGNEVSRAVADLLAEVS